MTSLSLNWIEFNKKSLTSRSECDINLQLCNINCNDEYTDDIAYSSGEDDSVFLKCWHVSLCDLGYIRSISSG